MIYGMNTGAAEKGKPRCKPSISARPTSYIYYRPYYGPASATLLQDIMQRPNGIPLIGNPEYMAGPEESIG